MALQSPPQPGFFEVMATPRAYTTLLYLLLSMATGIFAFTFTVTGLSLSLGLAILIIGIPVAVTFLAGARLLAVAEMHLLKGLVGGQGSEAPALLPLGEGWLARLKVLLMESRTWTSLLYFLLHLPLGIAYFSLLISLLAVGLGLLAVPVVRLLHLSGSFNVDLGGLAWSIAHPNLAAVLCGLAGLTLVPLTFHLAMLLGRFQVWLAQHLLVRT
jgi:hypothetical protein